MQPARNILAKIDDADTILLIHAGILLFQARDNCFHFRLRLGHGDTLAEAAEDNHGMVFAVQLRAIESHWHPHVVLAAGAEERKTPWENSDDGEGFLVEQNAPADDAGIAAEAPLPQSKTNDRNLIVADLIFLRDEVAAEGWLDAKETKEICGSMDAKNLLGFIGASEVVEPGAPGGKLFKRVILITPIEKLGGRSNTARNVAVWIGVPHKYDPLRIRKGKRTQQDSIDHAKHSGVCADADGEREYSDQRKARASPQHAPTVLQVLPNGSHR